MARYLVILWMFYALPSVLNAITTIHHDKPENSRIAEMATKMRQEKSMSLTVNGSTSVTASDLNLERQKRLLPYINYYVTRNNYQKPNYQQAQQPQQQEDYVEYTTGRGEKFTPFLESNALPGHFTPMIKSQQPPPPPQKNIQIQYIPEPSRPEKLPPNYGSIYDKLAQFKFASPIQQTTDTYKIHSMHQQHQHKQPQIAYIQVPVQHYDSRPYKNPQQPAKTIIETYTPTNIDLTVEDDRYRVQENTKDYRENLVYKIYRPNQQIRPQPQYIQVNAYKEERPQRPVLNFGDKTVIRKPIIFFQQKPKIQENYELPPPIRKPIIIAQVKTKPHVTTIVEDNYVAQKYTPIQFKPPPPPPPPPQPEPIINPVTVTEPDPIPITVPVQVQYEPDLYYDDRQPEPIPVQIQSPPYHHQQQSYHYQQQQQEQQQPSTLSHILKQLQDANALPHTLTPENIDNSIRTLVKILNALKRQQKLASKPIVVADESPEIEDESDGYRNVESHDDHTVTQSFPANTIEGGTPGRPGVDYPALSSIPQTSFNCKKQRYKGFFGDPHTNCQVWHYCDLNGGQASFLCPNGTIFSQVALTCDWWYNVKCSSTAQLYVLNERLYKYILPLSPKFPEDYSGPLVDKYLALKFKEMEEKMQKEKEEHGRKKEDEEKDDPDQLRDIQANKDKSPEET